MPKMHIIIGQLIPNAQSTTNLQKIFFLNAHRNVSCRTILVAFNRKSSLQLWALCANWIILL